MLPQAGSLWADTPSYCSVLYPAALAGPSFCADAIGLRLLCWNNFENYRLWEKSKYFITFAHMHSIRIMDNDCEYNELSQVQEMLLWPPQTAKSRHACA